MKVLGRVRKRTKGSLVQTLVSNLIGDSASRIWEKRIPWEGQSWESKSGQLSLLSPSKSFRYQYIGHWFYFDKECDPHERKEEN